MGKCDANGARAVGLSDADELAAFKKLAQAYRADDRRRVGSRTESCQGDLQELFP